jgi:hypothetical protein
MIRGMLVAAAVVEEGSACGEALGRIRGGSLRGFSFHRNRAQEKETTFI